MEDYFVWHYLEVWPKLLILWRNLTLFPLYYFSIPLHLKTFFAPWKRQTVKMKLGFHLDDFFGVIIINLSSRVMGGILRLSTIFYGLAVMPLLFVIGAITAILWAILIPWTLPFYLTKRISNEAEAQKLLKVAKGSLKQLVILILKSEEGKWVANRLGFDPKLLIKKFTESKEEGDLNQIPKLVQDDKNRLSDLYDAAVCSYMPFKKIISDNNIELRDVYETARWYEKLNEDGQIPFLLDLKKIKSLPGIGVDWAYGWTAEFDKYARDLTSHSAIFPLLIGRDKELSELERVLLKTEANNILVVGEPGVARHQLVETLAHRMKTGHTSKELSHKRVLALDMHSLTSSKPSILEVKGLASEMLEEAERAGNVIVFVDEIDKYLSSGEGRIDLTDVLSKFAESSVGLIGITTTGAYHKYIDSNSTLAKLFESVEISPPTLETVTSELEISIVPILEKKYKVIVSYPAVKKTIEDADKYLTSTPFPGKAIELLDQTIVYSTSEKKLKFVTSALVDEYLSSKLNMPMGDLDKTEREKLANLENLMHQRIINQEAAVHSVAAALRRSRLNIASPNRPVGTFLFLGPTGVGKTETAKALSSIYYGREEAMLRYDMSQYQKEEGLERLIGSIKLGTPGELTSKLLDKPFSLLLLDEIEKADREIFNLFLTLIDEGYISDHLGRKISAKNTIIIATSNAGAEFIRTNVQKGVSGEELQKTLLDYVQAEKIFSPEFINRFDATVVFTPLSEGNLREVARLMLESLNQRLKPKEIAVDITPDLIRKLAVLGNDPAYGARAMRRVITEKVEDQVAQKLLSGQVKKGEKIRIEI